MKKYIILILALALMTFAGCGFGEFQPTGATEAPTTQATVPPTTGAAVRSREETNIWVLLPDGQSLHWSKAGEDLQMLLSNLCYPVELVYADADPRQQAEQMTYALEQGADCLIVAPVDSVALTVPLEQAKDRGIPVISYDRLLMDSDAVSYHVSFDYRAMGAAIGQHIVTQKALDVMDENSSMTIEFFMGSPEDNNALLLYRGLMDVLQPYLEKGVLVSKSGRTAFEDTCVVDWDPQAASNRLISCLQDHYNGKSPDILCTVSDDFAAVCARILAAKEVREMPLITGLGATGEGKQNIAAGIQSVSLETDLFGLNEQCTQLVDALLTGKEPQINDTENCHNNVRAIPAYLCDFSVLTAEVQSETP